jgi:O-phosphoseryl-tRNA(Cys) synthetase
LRIFLVNHGEYMAGKPHEFEEFRQEVRQRLLRSGFDEVINRKGWPETVSAVSQKFQPPLRLFTIRRGASVAVMDRTISHERNQRALRDVLKAFGIVDYVLKNKAAYIERGGKRTKVAQTSLMMPDKIKAYSLRYPIFVVDINLERAGMLFYNAKSLKELLYPQLSKKFELTDKQIASMISIHKTPKTQLGKAISKSIVKTAERYGTKPSPARYRVYQRDVGQKRLEVWLINPKHGKMCGGDFLDEIYIQDGDICVGDTAVAQKATRTKIRLLDAFADHAASEIEQLHTDYDVISVEKAKNWNDINLVIPEVIENFTKANKKKIDVGADVGIRIEAKLI